MSGFRCTSDGDGSGQAFLTQNEIGNTDVDGGAVRLVSPLYDMTGGGYMVAYEYFLRLDNTIGGVDRLLVEMSSNGDAGPWAVVAIHDTDGGLDWRHHEIPPAELEAAGVVFTANMKGYLFKDRFQPYAVAGIGVMTARLEIKDTVGFDVSGSDWSTGFAARFGGGVDLYVTQHFVLNAEIRYVLPTGDVEGLDMISFGWGLQYRF